MLQLTHKKIIADMISRNSKACLLSYIYSYLNLRVLCLNTHVHNAYIAKISIISLYA